MGVEIGAVPTFKGASATKQQAVKVLEEAAEVFGAWQAYDDLKITDGDELMPHVVSECCDLIQATCNLLAGLGVTDLQEDIARCVESNERRGRKYDGR